MFSGIVETLGSITSVQVQDGCKKFMITPLLPFTDLKVGDSVAVNGVCLTVTSFTATFFCVTVVPETLRLTTLNQLRIKDDVNLERALKMNDRVGGHYLQGHVDTTGTLLSITPDDSDAIIVKISLPLTLSRYVVNKGYIGIDGMSITVIDSHPTWFTVTFIPHTQAVTIAKHYQPGQLINLEVDMMAKYIEKLIGADRHANPF